MREIPHEQFTARYAEGAELIDVREPYEYVAGHVPGARLMPMSQLTQHTHELPLDAPVYVICASGNRSLAVAAFLAGAGVDAWSVAGGTGAWIRAGRPLAYGTQSSVDRD